jgi:glycosyltransferase involved in cell wall biosynthesis
LPVKSTVIGNPYRATEFGLRLPAKRECDLIFVGRLVSAKGVNLLIDALAALGHQGHRPTLTIIGRGPEEQVLKAQVERLGLETQVRFTGEVRGAALVELLNAHKIMVIPSLWAEPFGLVALEAIACGCVIVGSSLGGLPDAIGPCGVTYPNGDAEALRRVLAELLDDPAMLESFRAPAEDHLKRFQPTAVAQAYLEIIQGAAGRAKSDE